jgi:hypothetical protein
MIILNTTGKSLQAVLSGAVATNEPTFICSYVDITPSTFLPGTTDGVLNGTTPVTIAGAPAASTQRQLKYLSIFNADTSPVVVSLKYVDSTTYVFMRVTLSPSYSLVYDADGWKVLNNNGAILTATTSASGGYYQVVESGGSPEPQEDALNFLSAFTVADNSGNGSTDISLAATGVTAATYGDSTHVVQLTINAAGQITAASAIAIGGGTVTTVSVVTNQGVSASISNPTTTPAITISLGALTGVTSLNGLVVTANTGVITTGTWHGTLIANNYGGTGVDSSASSGVAQLSSGSWSFSTVLANGTTATTQTSSDNSTNIATTAYVKSQGYGTGTVTSIGLTDNTGGFTVGSSPVTGSGSITITNKSVQTVTDASTVTFTVTSGIVGTVTLGGNRTLAISGAVNGGVYTLIVKQPSSGGPYTLAMPSGTKVAGAGGGAVVLSTAASAIDILTILYDGTNYWVMYGTNFT